ncbi:MAG: polysaccharide export protein [Candidatus Competibacteraceae bacterium]|nr:MAG: polysaccharide export protein [Candidatus Competibacteraceae bacterium]
MQKVNIPALLVLMVALLMLSACASTSTPPAETTSTPVASSASTGAGVSPTETSTPVAVANTRVGTEEYRIGPQDLLEIQVVGVQDLSRTVRVNSRGSISLPLVGVVKAAGLTSQELEAELATRLAKDYLQNPQVSVFIKEFTSQRVTVEGEVKKPGVYPIKGHITLLQSLATAEGITNMADASNIKVFRVAPDGTRSVQVFDLEQIRTGAAPDPEVRNDDVVQVGQSQGKAVAKGLMEFILPFRLLSPAL